MVYIIDLYYIVLLLSKLLYRSVQMEISTLVHIHYLDGLVQDCSNSIANALELRTGCIAVLH